MPNALELATDVIRKLLSGEAFRKVSATSSFKSIVMGDEITMVFGALIDIMGNLSWMWLPTFSELMMVKGFSAMLKNHFTVPDLSKADMRGMTEAQLWMKFLISSVAAANITPEYVIDDNSLCSKDYMIVLALAIAKKHVADQEWFLAEEVDEVIKSKCDDLDILLSVADRLPDIDYGGIQYYLLLLKKGKHMDGSRRWALWGDLLAILNSPKAPDVKEKAALKIIEQVGNGQSVDLKPQLLAAAKDGRLKSVSRAFVDVHPPSLRNQQGSHQVAATGDFAKVDGAMTADYAGLFNRIRLISPGVDASAKMDRLIEDYLSNLAGLEAAVKDGFPQYVDVTGGRRPDPIAGKPVVKPAENRVAVHEYERVVQFTENLGTWSPAVPVGQEEKTTDPPAVIQPVSCEILINLICSVLNIAWYFSQIKECSTNARNTAYNMFLLATKLLNSTSVPVSLRDEFKTYFSMATQPYTSELRKLRNALCPNSSGRGYNKANIAGVLAVSVNNMDNDDIFRKTLFPKRRVQKADFCKNLGTRVLTDNQEDFRREVEAVISKIKGNANVYGGRFKDTIEWLLDATRNEVQGQTDGEESD